LERWLGGLHHFPGGEGRIAKANWDRHCVEVVFRARESFSSVDGDALARLVFLAHDLGIRADVSGHGMNGMSVMLHPRVRDGRRMARHPTLEEAVAEWRERNAGLVAVGVRRG
jgi:hypothetical protein